MSENKRFISQPALARRWGRSIRTIQRLAQKEPHKLPPFIRLNGRKAFDLGGVETYESVAADTSADAQEKGSPPGRAATPKNVEAAQNPTGQCISNNTPAGNANVVSFIKEDR